MRREITTDPKRPSAHPDFLVEKALLFRLHWHHNDLSARDKIARQVFKHPDFRHVQRDGLNVETWWCHTGKYWYTWDPFTTQTFGTNGNSLGAAVEHLGHITDYLFGASINVENTPDGDYLELFSYSQGVNIAARVPGWLVAQFLRAVADSDNYGVDSSEGSEDDMLNGQQWLIDNSNFYPDTRETTH